MLAKLSAYCCLLAFLACTLVSCEEMPENQVVNLHFAAKPNNTDLVMGDDYISLIGQRYEFQTLMFYVSHVQLRKDDGSIVPLIDVALCDMADPAVITKTVPTGSYTSIEFGLGLDPIQNATDPVTVQPPNPLSYAIAPYWNWNSKYIFSKLEGLAIDDTNGEPDSTFLFHIGTDALFRQITVSKPFELGKEPIDLTVTLNIDKLLTYPQVIDLITNGYTQTLDNFEDAESLVNNFAIAFE